MQPSLVFFSGKSCGHRSLVSYSPWSCKESDMTERLLFLSFFLFKLPKSKTQYITGKKKRKKERTSGLVHWDDPEGRDGEGGWKGDRDGEHM